MTAQERRAAIVEVLSRSHQPVSAGALARRFGVSRQLIVGDVALLRAAAEKVGETAAAYDQLFQSFTSITSHISGELRKLDVTAAQLPISFNHLKDGLHQLQEQARERAAEE